MWSMIWCLFMMKYEYYEFNCCWSDDFNTCYIPETISYCWWFMNYCIYLIHWMILHVNILLLGKWLYVWCEILIYYAWVRNFFMVNVILPSSGFLVASPLWCKRAGWGRLRRREYPMIACGFLVFIACFGV